jgi:hypothetical protein
MIFTVRYETDIDIRDLAQDIYDECVFSGIKIDIPCMVNDYLTDWRSDYYIEGWTQLLEEQKQPVFDAVEKAIEDIRTGRE